LLKESCMKPLPSLAPLSISLVATCLGLAAAACGGDSGDGDDGFAEPAVVEDFADQVVVPTYELLAERTALLDVAVEALAEEPTPVGLTAAQDAWVAMREPWEQSESFLFGPVDAEGWDPAMDSWPLNTNDLEAVLESDDELTQAYVAALPETQKGFHAVEFLLWGEDGAKTSDEITPRELEYLGALTDELVSVTDQLATSWTEAYQGGASYRERFATAGADGNTAYPSLEAAVQEILVGMSGICDEVANGKIAGPFDARDPNLVESQYNFNSLIDFADNIRGVRNAYTGSMPLAGTEGASVSAYVAARDPELDEHVRAHIDEAIAAIGAIPSPFRDAILDEANDDVIIAAQEAIRHLQETIDGELTTLVLGS
jgi:putative iron-regulated protein